MSSSAASTSSWAGPFGGVPPFGSLSPAELQERLDATMASALAAAQAVGAQRDAATFDNTMVPLEHATVPFEQYEALYSVATGNISDEAIRAMETVMEPRFAAFRDKLSQDSAIFARVEALHAHPERLTPEQARLVDVQLKSLRLHGAQLDETAKKRVMEINAKLSELFTQFSHKVLHDEDTYVELTAADLDGLAPDFVASAAELAKSKGKPDGVYLVANTRSAVEPFLSTSKRRDLREAVFRKFIKRGANGDQHDTSAEIKQILALRLERARLMGFATHVHYRLENTMAATPAAAEKLMLDVWGPAVQRVKEEVASMKEIAGHDIEAWDYRFFAELVRQKQFDLDLEEVKPYMQLHNIRDALFYCAERLFGLRFALTQHPVPVFHPDVTVWEVTRVSDGTHVGLWYFDPFARQGAKRSGAWMSEYRPQSGLLNSTPIVSNNANFIKATGDSPVLISFDDAVTMFHEFGHALHGLLSHVTYPSLAGTRVFVDFVEFPSQLLEHWLLVPEVLQRFAVNAQGEAIPAALVKKIQASQKFLKGFDTTEYLASALVDFRMHLETGPIAGDVVEYEQRLLHDIGMPREMAMRHASNHFMHVWSSDHYAACYWSYLWADSLVADAYEAFGENAFDASVAGRLKQHVFASGNKVDPSVAYRSFRGRDPSTDALMRKRGFQ